MAHSRRHKALQYRYRYGPHWPSGNRVSCYRRLPWLWFCCTPSDESFSMYWPGVIEPSQKHHLREVLLAGIAKTLYGKRSHLNFTSITCAWHARPGQVRFGNNIEGWIDRLTNCLHFLDRTENWCCPKAGATGDPQIYKAAVRAVRT